MGQSSFNLYQGGGGSGGTNWWTNGGSGTVIEPISIVTAINSIISAVTTLYQDAVSLILQYNSGGNTNSVNVSGTGVQINSNTPAGDLLTVDVGGGSGEVKIYAQNSGSVSAANETITPTSIDMTVESGGSTGAAELGDQLVEAYVLAASGDESRLSLTPLNALISVTVAGSNSSVDVEQNSVTLSTSPSGGSTQSLGIAQGRQGIITNQYTLAAGVMPATTLGKIAIYSLSGSFIGNLQLTN